MHVVVIDDDEDLRFTTGLALKTGGFTPIACASCDEAIDVLGSGDVRPAAILVDIHLGHGSVGPQQFVQWLRSHGFEKVPVLVVSGSPDVAAIAKAMAAAGYLTKPFDISTLMDQLEAVTR